MDGIRENLAWGRSVRGEPSQPGRDGIGLYARALKAAVVHLVSRLNVFRAGYERLTSPATVPPSVAGILVLCKGNICRSPLAHVYLEEALSKANLPVIVKSAGIETTPGKPAHDHAKTVALTNGLSLATHRTTPLYEDLVKQTDLVLVMEVAQKDRVLRLYPEVKGKVFVLGQFCRRGALDIDDPYSGPLEDFMVCFGRIVESCDRIVGMMAAARTPQTVQAQTGSGPATSPKAAMPVSSAD